MDLTPGLSAGIADPLWLLLRQWQLGELTGDDGGTPVAVDVASSWSRFTRFRPEGSGSPGQGGSGEGMPLGEGDGPLERMVEREAVLTGAPQGVPWAAAVQAGRAFRRRLQEHGVGAVADRLMAAAPQTIFSAAVPDGAVSGPHEARFTALLAGKVLDGARVLELLDGPGLPVEAIGADYPAQVEAAVLLWRTDLAEEWGAPASSSWVSDRLEYAFSIGAPPLPPDDFAALPAEGAGEEIVLRAAEYDGTGVAWHSLDLDRDPGAVLGAAADGDGPHAGDSFGAGPTGRQVRSMLAAPLSYPGMPAQRYWEFEDATVSLGNASAGPTDLARLLAIDFAVVYSPDWFLVPVELPVGCVARVDWVIVRDSFGVATVVGTAGHQAGDGAGRMFQPDIIGGAGVADVPLLVVLPSALGAANSEPLEDVALQRDEAANLAWAIESRILGPAGRGVDRPWLRSEFALEAATTAEAYDLVWRLATPVAQPWTPLVAVNGGDGTQPMLRRARLLETETGDVRSAQGVLMGGVHDICDEEITRSGINVRLLDQLARGCDGSSYIWRGRTKQAWKGEASSGLRFDAATPRPTP
ncbi:hypothetical protein [Arthrobacter sp. 35W]|uniref:hypothetical protein n=1 Tax=Arthrobacter sp. 35W TaxID=1132441 RepID=UPI0012DD52E9|nr:hypothetical protein [Arthrobacter sp. 35W]